MNILITGTSKGIGFELVKKFLVTKGNQYNIFALSRNVENLKTLEKKNKNLVPIQCDITNQKQLETALELVIKRCSKIDYLINNAGLLISKSFQEIQSHEIDNIFNTNFKAPFFIIKKLFPLLALSPNAHVVNISSMGGFQGATKFQGLSAYSSSKAALTCLTECLAEEFKGTSIKINALCIGAVQTEMLQKAFPDYVPPVSAVQMAEFIFHFTCNNHNFMNGKIIPVALTNP